MCGGSGGCAPSEHSCEQDRHDRLDALRPREAGHLDAGRGRRLDRRAQGHDEVLELVLGHRLDHRLEREPGGLDDSVVPVGERRDELPDPVDAVLGKVLLGDLAEGLAVGREQCVRARGQMPRSSGGRRETHKQPSALTRRRGASPLAQPRSVIISVLRPSMSSIDCRRTRIVWATSVWISSSPSVSIDLTRACRTAVRRRLRAEPATDTSEPSARALNADIWPPMRAGRTTGKIELARTAMISRSARRAVSDCAPGCRRASSRVGIVWSMALVPNSLCRSTSNDWAAAARTAVLSSTSAVRTPAMMASWCSSSWSSVALSLERSGAQKKPASVRCSDGPDTSTGTRRTASR